MKKFALILLVMAFAMVSVVPAFAAEHQQGPKSTGPGDCNYGVTHAFLARSGLTGKAHIPGLVHTGASGFCAGMPNAN